MSPRKNAYTTEDASIKPAVKVANGVSIQKVSAPFNNISKYFYYGLSDQSSADSFFLFLLHKVRFFIYQDLASRTNSFMYENVVACMKMNVLL